MKLARFLLLASAAIFVGVGAIFLFFPANFAAVLEIGAPTAMARMDLRATYGGLELGFGIFLIICAVKRQWIRPGLWALGLATGGFATGRLVGLVAEKTMSSLMLVCLVLEILVTVLAVLIVFRRQQDV